MAVESFAEKWKAGRKIFAVILIIDVFAILAAVFLPVALPDQFGIPGTMTCPETSDECITTNSNMTIFAALGIIIVVSLIGFLAFFNRMSNSSDLTKGEMRKTFAITIIMVYLLVMSLIITGHIKWDQDSELFQNFTYVVITVIIFYFGSRAYKQASGNDKDQNDLTNSGKSDVNAEVAVNEANVYLAKAERAKAEAESATYEAEATTTKNKIETIVKNIDASKRNLANTKDETLKKIIAEEIKIKEHEGAKAEEKLSETETKLSITKDKINSAISKVDDAEKNAESSKNKLLNPDERIAKAKTDLILAKIESALAETKAESAKNRAVLNELTILKPTAPQIITNEPTSPHIQKLMDDIAAKFQAFVDANKPNVSGKDILDHKRQFTESVGNLISQRYDEINNAISELDPKDAEMPKQKQILVEQKSQVPNGLAIRKIDQINLNTKLNEILKEQVPNGSLEIMINDMDLTGLSAREISALISEGLIPPMHLGPKSFEVLKQELFSLQNSFTSSMTAAEKAAFNEKLKTLTHEILQLPENKREQLYDMVDQMLHRQ